MEKNKNEQRNYHQNGKTSDQPTTKDVNQKEVDNNKPVEQSEVKNYPSVFIEEEDVILNGSNKITNVTRKKEINSKEVTDKDIPKDQITNERNSVDIGLNRRTEDVNL